MRLNHKNKVRNAADWEFMVATFIREAIENPDDEVEITEDLLKYFMTLIREDRAVYKHACMEKFNAAMRMLVDVSQGKIGVAGDDDEE